MKLALVFIQIVSAVLLIILVLLHSAKGEGLGGIGGVAHVFGSQKGLEEGLDKLTTTTAIVFVSISIIISILGV